MKKGIWWSDPNENIQILEPTEKALKKFGYRYGVDNVILTEEHITALREGKVIAFHDSECSTFLRMQT